MLLPSSNACHVEGNSRGANTNKSELADTPQGLPGFSPVLSRSVDKFLPAGVNHVWERGAFTVSNLLSPGLATMRAVERDGEIRSRAKSLGGF